MTDLETVVEGKASDPRALATHAKQATEGMTRHIISVYNVIGVELGYSKSLSGLPYETGC